MTVWVQHQAFICSPHRCSGRAQLQGSGPAWPPKTGGGGWICGLEIKAEASGRGTAAKERGLDKETKPETDS